MKQLHTDFYAEVNSKWGMSRGSSVSETGKKHRSTEEYRRMLSEECSTIEENISRHQQVLSSLHSDIRMAERRVKGLTSMVENLKKEQAEKEAQLSALKNDMEARKGDAQTYLPRKKSSKMSWPLSRINWQTNRRSYRPLTDNFPSSRKIWMPFRSGQEELKERSIQILA